MLGSNRAFARVAAQFALLATLTAASQAEEVLPEIVVEAQRPASPRPSTAPQPQPNSDLASKNVQFGVARSNLLAPIGSVPFNIGHDTIEALPQGVNAPVDKVLLQAPGVTQDSAASGALHVRNEHANVQYRINGIMLPDGVSGFGQLLESSFIGNMALITGALPAQFGLRTAGVVDVTTKSGTTLNGGSVGIYGGSRKSLTPSLEYGGTTGKTDYFFSGRFLKTNQGIENPTPSLNAIHDDSTQWRGFGYASTFLDDWTRVTVLTGAQQVRYQIPNNPGQPTSPLNTSINGITTFDSSTLNERQFETNYYGVAAWQRSINGFDVQLSSFSRYSSLHFQPDTVGDLLLNGVASDVHRSAFINGFQGDGSYRLSEAHTLRAGFSVSGEYTQVSNSSIVESCVACDGTDTGALPFTLYDSSSKLGWLAGIYLQDEWKITNELTLNLGMRFDQMWQYVDANQLSPRINLVYKPFDGTTFHAGYARYFTPPPQAIAAPANVALFNNTTAAAPCTAGPGCTDPVLPERSYYYDAGVTQMLLPGLQVGVDAYYKIAKDLLDDGQFGQAYVLDGFNYAKAYNYGVELSGSYTSGLFKLYGNFAWGLQQGTNIVSNQYLFSQVDLAYIASHYIYTDHTQIYTASAGTSYGFGEGTRVSLDMIYGSGLRKNLMLPDGSVIPNGDHVGPYAQFNVGISHEFKPAGDSKPLTVRFDVVNLFDTIYQIRSGSGVGVFAPQYGPRRGFFVGLSQKI